MEPSERFAELFRGFTARYGVFKVLETEASGKRTGRARTVDKPVTPEIYAAHVKGETGVGVIPLTQDDKVHFAALDIDHYRDDDEWVWDVVEKIQDEPLIVTRSKSGGVHIWLFMQEAVPAQKAIDYLRLIAARIGHADCEVFPKQAARASQEDVGNWINLPYFGDTRKACVMRKTALGLERAVIEIGDFLGLAEQCAKYAAEDKLIELSRLEKDQRQISEKTDDWLDGPPCLQRLLVGLPQKEIDSIQKRFDEGKITEDQYHKQIATALPQLTDGGRDTTFFNAAQYLYRKHGGTAQEIERRLVKVHEAWQVRTGQPGLDDSEIAKCAKQAAKDNWSYQCSVQPLKAFCHRGTCLRRKHGVASKSSESPFEITSFTVIKTDPPQNALNINGKRVCMDGKVLLNQRTFREKLYDGAGVVWPPMQESKFLVLVGEWRSQADEVDGPPDTGLGEIIAHCLVEFCTGRKVVRGTGKDEKIASGFALWSEDEVWFLIREFETYLGTNGVRIDPRDLGNRLMNDIGCTSKQTSVKRRSGDWKSIRPYVIKAATLEGIRGEPPTDDE